MRRAAIVPYFAVAGLLALCAADGTPVDNRAKFGLSDPNAPISVSADRLDADQNSKTLVYTGNAIVRQGDVYLHTDVLRVVAPDGKTPDKIYAQGHVVVTSAQGTATGEAAVYDVTPRILTLTGHVVLSHEDNVMRGEKMVVNLITGVANLGAGASSSTASPPGSRVQGLFTPKSDKDEVKK